MLTIRCAKEDITKIIHIGACTFKRARSGGFRWSAPFSAMQIENYEEGRYQVEDISNLVKHETRIVKFLASKRTSLKISLYSLLRKKPQPKEKKTKSYVEDIMWGNKSFKTTETIENTPWAAKFSDKFFQNYDKKTEFNFYAFDFETNTTTLEPFMLCISKVDYFGGKPYEFKSYGAGPSDPESFMFDFWSDIVIFLGKAFNACNIYTSFNGACFDNFFLLRTWHKFRKNRIAELTNKIKMTYIQANGAITSLTLSGPKMSTVIFRDILRFLPADKKGSMKKVCENLKLPFQKEDCSIQEIHKAWEYVQTLKMKGHCFRPSKIEDANYKKVYHYCLVDTFCVFGIMDYMGKLYMSVEEFREIFAHPICPPEYGYLFFFFTLAQSAYRLFPYAAMNPPEGLPAIDPDQLGKTFSAVSKSGQAQIIRRSIYGGKTLSPAIGLTVVPPPGTSISCWDISSMYPCAALGPQPAGECSQATCENLEEWNKALYNKSFHSGHFPPFIGYCGIMKVKPKVNHVATRLPAPWDTTHCIDDIFPFVPYRSNSADGFSDDKASFLKNATGSLEWISHTGGKVLYGFYNSIDIHTMSQLGFEVTVLNRPFKVLKWEMWSDMLSSAFRVLYARKYLAKQQGDENSELIFKILLNGTIGKFAQRPMEDVIIKDGIPYRTGKANSRNVTLYQLNSFIMSYSRRLSLGLFCSIAFDDPEAWINALSYSELWRSRPVKRIPLYSDTDNCVFIHNISEEDGCEDALKRMDLSADGSLGAFKAETVTFDFHVEPERWHKPKKDPLTGLSIPNPCKSLSHSGLFIFARKFYLLKCAGCNDLRLKNKGHNTEGIDPMKFAKIFDVCETRKDFILQDPHNFCECATCTTIRLFTVVIPEYTAWTRRRITSGKRFSIKKTLAPTPFSSYEAFSLAPSEIERCIQITVPYFQKRCPMPTCKFLVHK